MNKIGRISYRFSLLFKVLFILYPLFTLAIWFGLITLPQGYCAILKLPQEIKLETVPLNLRIYAGLVHLIPTVVVMCSFYFLIKLFQLYAKNIMFSPQNVILIRKIGFTLLFQVIAGILIQPILTGILTSHAAKGERIVAIGFGSDDLSTLIIGGMVVLISWIMEEGRKLEEETTLTI